MSKFDSKLPRAATSILLEKLTKQLQAHWRKIDTKAPRDRATWYLNGVQDVLAMLGMPVPPYWVICTQTSRPIADSYLYGRRAIQMQSNLASRLMDWHGGQSSGLYAISSCMLHCSDKGKLYRAFEHGRHMETDVFGRALAELRELRARANHPEAVTAADEKEANELADELEAFVTVRALHLVPVFDILEPAFAGTLDRLIGRDRTAEEETQNQTQA